MRMAFLLPLCCAIALPAQAQSGISGITSFMPSYPAEPITGYGIDNFRSPAAQGPAADMQKAQALVAAGRYAEADPLLSSLMGKTSSKQVRFLKGVTKLGLGDAAAARRYFEKSLYRGRNGNPGAMSGLALAEIRLGNADAANDLLRKLRYQQDVCADNCDRANALEQAVTVVEKALI
jgi:hypothetical protein